IEKFFQAGFDTVHCNIHYLSDIVQHELKNACEYVGYNPNRIKFWHEKDILETGGGIARIYHELCLENSSHLKKDLIVVSGDIVADFPLENMLFCWQNKKENEHALLCTNKLKQIRKDATYVDENSHYVLGFGEKFGQEHAHSPMIAKNFT